MKVLIIPDTHFPFQNTAAVNTILEAIHTEKPNAVIQIGDLLDQYLFSKYSRSAGISPDEDVEKGLTRAVEMWECIKSMVPKAKLYQILGNHDVRIKKRIQEALPELLEVYNPLGMYEFDGVETLQSDRDFLTLDGVVYTHGWLSKSIDHAKYFNKPTVHGHRHRPSVETDGKLWSMDVGFVGNEKSLPMSYTMSKHSKWRMAYGIVENRLPRLILL